MAMKGMDDDAVRTMGNQMKTKGDEIKQIVIQIGSLVEGAQWMGPDADKFKGDWPTLKNSITTAADALVANGNLAVQNADGQRDVSSH